jgi:Rieske Fe-S protein
MRDDPGRPPSTTRRTFLAWSIGGLLSATVVAVAGPIVVYLWPPRMPREARGKIRVPLSTPLSGIQEGQAVRFDAPPGKGFVMADGGGVNAAGNVTYGGFVTRAGGQVRALAITCPHLGCAYGFDQGKGHFLCPCHGSQFALDGRVLHGPATSPLSHLTWQRGATANEIEVEGLSVG